jgi:transcriptional regulator with XRE-family HTH domain
VGREVKDLNEKFSRNLRAARKAVPGNLSQESLARMCGVHRTEISLLERAKREPRLGTLIKLASSLDVSIDKLAEDITWKPLD